MSDIILTEIKNSSTVDKIGYDAINKTLQVVFHKTGLYEYYDIPVEHFRELAKARAADEVRKGESVGAMLKVVVKGKRFKRIK